MHFNQKTASYEAGFQRRLNQLLAEEQETQVKSAMMAGLGRLVGGAARGFHQGASAAGRGIQSIPGRLQQAGQNFQSGFRQGATSGGQTASRTTVTPISQTRYVPHAPVSTPPGPTLPPVGNVGGGSAGTPNWLSRFGVGPVNGPAAGRFSSQLDWINQNPALAGGGVMGAGATLGANELVDAQKRNAIENLSAMDRLALAYQLMVNPDRVAEMVY
jgi:hypothetical protein